MTRDRPLLYFDFIDPLSRRMGVELASLDEVGAEGFDWEPLELRPPPMALTTLDEPEIAERWAEAGATDHLGRAYAPPPLVPWTRKAHELVRYAAETGKDARIRDAIFDAYMIEGRDIGRIDVLVDVARAVGLDPGEVKPALDVDRYEAEIAAARTTALAAGGDSPPTLVLGDRVLRGFHNAAAIRTFLGT